MWNYAQGLASYTINSTNVASECFYGSRNLGTTGLNAKTYGGTGGYGNQDSFGTVGTYGQQFDNSQMIGAFYSYTQGNLNLVPEVQYQYAKANATIWPVSTNRPATWVPPCSPPMPSPTPRTRSGAGLNISENIRLPATKRAAVSPAWFIGPNAEAIGAAVAPTWQYKDLFARANAGATYLLNNKDFSTASYGGDGMDKFQFVGTLEAGLLF